MADRSRKSRKTEVKKSDTTDFEARYVGPLAECQGLRNGVWTLVPTKDKAMWFAGRRSFQVRKLGQDRLLSEQEVAGEIRSSEGAPSEHEIAVALREADRRTLKPRGKVGGEVPHNPGYTPSSLEAGDLPPAGLPFPEEGQPRVTLKNPISQRLSDEHIREIRLSQLPREEAAALGLDPKVAIRESTARLSEQFKNTSIRNITRVG